MSGTTRYWCEECQVIHGWGEGDCDEQPFPGDEEMYDIDDDDVLGDARITMEELTDVEKGIVRQYYSTEFVNFSLPLRIEIITACAEIVRKYRGLDGRPKLAEPPTPIDLGTEFPLDLQEDDDDSHWEESKQ